MYLQRKVQLCLPPLPSISSLPLTRIFLSPHRSFCGALCLNEEEAHTHTRPYHIFTHTPTTHNLIVIIDTH